MKHNIVSYNKNDYPVFRYSEAIETFFFYKYSLNYKKKQYVSIGPVNSKIYLEFHEKINDNYKREIKIGDDYFWSQTKEGLKTTKIQIIPSKSSFFKSVTFEDGDRKISIEKLKGNYSVSFKIEKEKFDNYKEILNGKRN